IRPHVTVGIGWRVVGAAVLARGPHERNAEALEVLIETNSGHGRRIRLRERIDEIGRAGERTRRLLFETLMQRAVGLSRRDDSERRRDVTFCCMHQNGRLNEVKYDPHATLLPRAASSAGVVRAMQRGLKNLSRCRLQPAQGTPPPSSPTQVRMAQATRER